MDINFIIVYVERISVPFCSGKVVFQVQKIREEVVWGDEKDAKAYRVNATFP